MEMRCFRHVRSWRIRFDGLRRSELSLRIVTGHVALDLMPRWRDFAERTMGWEATKDGLADLIFRSYSEAELKGQIAFLESPEGKSMRGKTRQFQHDYALMLAKKSQGAASSAQVQAAASAAFEEDAGSASDVVATLVEEHTLNGQTYFTGALENRGKEPVHHPQVEINLFQAGKFVDQYSTYVSGSVVAGTPRYFKVNCGCKDSPPAQHDTFKVSVIRGF